MTLRIHDTLRRAKVDFEPIDAGHVKLYVCGPTVYDYAHIGNARPVVVFDVLVRLLRRSIRDITEETARIFHEDMAALGASPPDVEPRATEHIAQMIAMIETLIEKGHAYEAEGHVLFSVPSMPEYGALSKLDKREIVAGARVDIAPYKRDASDFVLWKPSDGDTPGWESPWSYGRPGWHIECSAMSLTHLGAAFDIHGGGQDLIFPHHENEIAQSTCALGHDSFARYWMHNGYLMSEGEKMSKSLGNFYTVHDLLEEFPGEAIRLVLMQSHYRQPLDFTKSGIAEARRTLDRWYRVVEETGAPEGDVPETLIQALSDDLNTPQALAELHRLAGSDAVAFVAGARFMGLLRQDPEAWFKWQPAGSADGLDDAIDALILERAEARASKDFARSDEIRDQLAAEGIVLEDGAGGTTWRRG
jgi:cysteinyl-tRNA synthetase